MEILYMDRDIIVCIKPPRVLSTDEPGGLPDLIRQELGDPDANVRTVHRLDRVVSGLMVLARRSKAASELSRQMREGCFHKEYLAVIHGVPNQQEGIFQDLLLRNKQKRKTYVVDSPQKDTQEAVLKYKLLSHNDVLSRVQIVLQTGRTHQIRVQFSSRGYPLVGDRKYGIDDPECEIALWSNRLRFLHPYSGSPMEFTSEPPEVYPWTEC